MESRIVETIGQIALEECLAAPCAGPEVVEERRAAVEAAGLDWLAMLRWIAENRPRIVALAKEAWELIQTFPRPKAPETEEPPQAIDAAAIVMLITTLAPMIEKLLAAIRQRKNPPSPTPAL